MFFRLVMATMLLASTSAGQALAQQINLSPTQIERLGIQTRAAEAATTLNLATIPGKITAPLHARLAIAVPFGGTVLTVDVLEGVKVDDGKPLLSIASSDYLNAQAELLQHESEYRIARASADRVRKLASEGIAAESRVEEAEAHAAQIKAALTAMRSRLSQTEQVPDQADVYRLVARDSATVATLEVEPGQSVNALDTVIVVQATEQVWLEASLPAALAALVGLGDSVSVSPGDIQGNVIAVGLNVDPRTRSVVLRAEINHGEGTRPGQNVLATIFGQAPAGALMVPREALVRLAGVNVVFVARNGSFEVVQSNILGLGRESATIAAPMTPGDQVAVRGLTELKALAQQDN